MKTSIQGHGIILNLDSYLPFVFEFNPSSLDTSKKINYVMAPNIGGSHKKRYFTGFDNKEVTFTIMCLDNESIFGVLPQIAYFEQLREPSVGLLGLGTLYDNANYPPPQILFQFGVSLTPLVWDVLDVKINASHFHSGHVSGIIGIPRKAEITVQLGLDETDSVLNTIAKLANKVESVYGSAESVLREVLHKTSGYRKAGLRKEAAIYPSSISQTGW